MNKLKQKLAGSRIVQKVVKRILIIEVISLLLTFLLSYAVLWPRLTDNAIREAVGTNNEIGNQINTTITNMTDSSQFLITSNELKNILNEYYFAPDEQSFNRVCLTINNLISSMSFIKGAVLEDADGPQFTSIINLREQDFFVFDSALYQEVKSSSYQKGYTSIYNIAASPASYGMAYICNYYIGTRNYTLTIFYNVNTLVSTVNNLSSTLFNGCALTDFQGNIFYDTGDFSRETTGDETVIAYSSHPYEKSGAGYYFYSIVPITGWNIIGYMESRTLYATFAGHFLITLLLCLISCTIVVLMIVPSVSRIIRPIHELNKTMQFVAAGDLDCYSSIHTDDEIGDLSAVYNQMIDSLNQHIDSLVEYEAKEARMKYNLLIAQIDSHFIYNTMSIINSFARRQATTEIIAINSALMKILQNCLRVRAIDVTDSVAQEIDIVDQYWLIENMRYDNQAELIWQVPDELKYELIPKNLIQPLVENCLFHGLVDEETGIINGTITISIAKSCKAVTISVADDGIGIPESTLAFLNDPENYVEQFNERGKHIGLSNIRQRLDYIYQGQASMRIENRDGTVVTMVLPLV